jgi:hypothetical protein
LTDLVVESPSKIIKVIDEPNITEEENIPDSKLFGVITEQSLEMLR